MTSNPISYYRVLCSFVLRSYKSFSFFELLTLIDSHISSGQEGSLYLCGGSRGLLRIGHRDYICLLTCESTVESHTGFQFQGCLLR